ncbi:nucleotidyltransferase domain-containing protein [Patescibacteria group bacterium]|nr:nucleotidyltransferase domain-containing protein [Patescibacteria group bacterium]
MDRKKISKKIIRAVQAYGKRLANEEKLPIDKVIVFGSQAKGKPRYWSDIDVCIISSKFKNGFEALQFLWARRNEQDVKAHIEPVGFSKRDFNEGSSLIQEIKKTGVEVKI